MIKPLDVVFLASPTSAAVCIFALVVGLAAL
jgi:hypothetical protein